MNRPTLVLAACRLAMAAALFAQTTPARLSLDEALASGLAADPACVSASFEARAAKFREAEARFKLLPSIALSAGYTQLSQEPALSFSSLSSSELQSLGPYLSTLESFEPMLDDLLGGVDHSADFRLDLQYPIIASLSLEKAAEAAKYQALGKEADARLAKQNLVYMIKRAYWEAQRAAASVETMQKALDVEAELEGEIHKLYEQGMAGDADELDEKARHDQAKLALDEALSGRDLAFLVLSSLVGDKAQAQAASPDYVLTTMPKADDTSVPPESPGEESGPPVLVDKALAQRPELSSATMDVKASEASEKAEQLSSLPSLALKGSLSYADPDPRVFPEEDRFNLSWAIGLRVSYDLGALPGSSERAKAADAELSKARSELDRQRAAVSLDVRRCYLTLVRDRDSLELTKGLVAQVEEGLRVAEQKYKAGTAKYSEVLQAQLALVRARFVVESRLFDIEIAEADLARSIGG